MIEMGKVTKAHCPECNKDYNSFIEITTDPRCPDCGTVYLDQWESEEITCENEACYTSEKLLIKLEAVYNAQKKADKLSENISKEKDKDKRLKLMQQQREALNSIKGKLRMEKGEKWEDFIVRQEKMKYVCSNCEKSLTKAQWKEKKYICPKCKEPQMVKITRDKTVFTPKEAKHITVVCPKYHTIARVRRD